MFRYWGEKLEPGDDGFLGKTESKRRLNQLFPGYGGMHYTNPAILVTHGDGTIATELVYESSEIRRTGDNVTETRLTLKDSVYPFTVELLFTAYRDEDVITQSVSVSHSEPGPVRLGEVASFFVPLKAPSYWLTHFHGSSNAEMQVAEERLQPGIKTIESKRGLRTTHNESPSFMLSPGGPPNEKRGPVYAGSLAWSGNYRLSFQLDDCGVLNIGAGMNPFAGELVLEPGETLHTPEMVLTFSSGGAGQASRNLHRWSRRYSLAHGGSLRPVALNNWEGTLWNIDEKTVKGIIDGTAELGCELFVLDDGWFGNKYPRDNDANGLGDWEADRRKLPRGLDDLAGYAVKKGIRFGIWIEPEMVNPNSELAGRHPEWIVKSGERSIPKSRNQWLLDLTNPEVQDHVFGVFDGVMGQSPHISYIKWDANRSVANVGSQWLPADRQSHFWYEYTKGLYAVYERIREKYPDVEIQACASGGGRVDFGSLAYHDEFWTSDNTNAVDRVFIQWGTNMIFPAIAAASHVSASPNRQTGSVLPLKFRCDVAMSGRMGVELDPRKLSAEERDYLKAAIADYKKIRHIVQFGDLYRLISPYDDGGWASSSFVSENRDEAVLFAFSMKFHHRERFEVGLDGLDPAGNYVVAELRRGEDKKSFASSGEIFSGDFLMKHGLQIDINKPSESCVLHLRRIDTR